MYSGHPLGLFPSHKDAPRVCCYKWNDEYQITTKPDDLGENILIVLSVLGLRLTYQN